MKKILFLTLLFAGVILYADVPTAEVLSQKFQQRLKSEQILFDGLVSSKIIFSKEEYNVGDTIDITVQVKVNIEKNIENLNFAITDFKNTQYYAFPRYFPHITKEGIDSMHNKLITEDALLKFIESDSDLIVNNDNPTGTYHLKFKLTRKVKPIISLGISYPFIVRDLSIYAHSESNSYPFITEYIGEKQRISIPIKIHPSARKDENQPSEPEMKSNPQDFPERETPKFPANKAESYNKKNSSD
jgi:hypothetical protein